VTARVPEGTWREHAVARSLDPARARAEARVQRFLDAALSLMSDNRNGEFTLQQVVERSGQSLRSFYQHFEGKHELLLALFEESVRAAADHLRAAVASEDDPLARVHRFTVEYHEICRPSPEQHRVGALPVPVMADFAQSLLTSHPQDAARAFAPLVALFEEVLDGAAAAGVVRPDLPRTGVTGLLLQAIMFNAFAATISGVPVRHDTAGAAEDLWELVVHGLSPRH
jgi:AcrR family transcriptional regulator